MFAFDKFFIGDKKRPNILINCDHGLMIINRFDNNTISGIGGFLLDHGNNNTVEADLTIKLLENVSDPIIFDIGSNIGTYANWIGKWAMERNGKVYCFEPQRQIFQILCGNMAINNIDNIHAHFLALGKQDGFIDLLEADYTKEQSNFGSFSLDGIDRKKYSNTQKLQRVQITTLDKFVTDWQVPKIDFIKIDAEGLDIDVIEGGLQTIRKFKPDLFVEFINLGPSKNEDTSEQGKNTLISVLENLGYKTFVVGNDILATMKQIQQ